MTLKVEDWKDLNNLLLRDSTFSQKDLFQPGEQLSQAYFNYSKILIVGAGGLGCELLKDLALTGFKEIHIIDMDTIDLTNLNRQFFFRLKDVGKFKANIAAEYLSKIMPSVKVVPIVGKIQDQPRSYYQQFPIIIAGLDNIEARRWLNMLVHLLVEWNPDNTPVLGTQRILIDGGSEGFRGQVNVIIPYKTACYECTLGTLTPQVKYNFCTISNQPRQPEHCVQYAQLILWPEQFKFSIDTDNMEHMKWIYDKAFERGEKYHIQGVTFEFTLGVVKNIIPAIASTNALIAAACANEAFKAATACATNCDNYFMYMGQISIYGQNFQYEKDPKCLICSKKLEDK